MAIMQYKSPQNSSSVFGGLNQTYIRVVIACIHFLQCFTTLLVLGVTISYPSLCTTLIAVACTQFDKLKAAILDIRQQHITPHHRHEDEQVHTIANCDLQAKLNACIRHHQNIMA
jgi:hypothetical protein